MSWSHCGLFNLAIFEQPINLLKFLWCIREVQIEKQSWNLNWHINWCPIQLFNKMESRSTERVWAPPPGCCCSTWRRIVQKGNSLLHMQPLHVIRNPNFSGSPTVCRKSMCSRNFTLQVVPPSIMMVRHRGKARILSLYSNQPFFKHQSSFYFCKVKRRKKKCWK